jgi:hypothetical protein
MGEMMIKMMVVVVVEVLTGPADESGHCEMTRRACGVSLNHHA